MPVVRLSPVHHRRPKWKNSIGKRTSGLIVSISSSTSAGCGSRSKWPMKKRPPLQITWFFPDRSKAFTAPPSFETAENPKRSERQEILRPCAPVKGVLNLRSVEGWNPLRSLWYLARFYIRNFIVRWKQLIPQNDCSKHLGIIHPHKRATRDVRTTAANRNAVWRGPNAKLGEGQCAKRLGTQVFRQKLGLEYTVESSDWRLETLMFLR